MDEECKRPYSNVKMAFEVEQWDVKKKKKIGER